MVCALHPPSICDNSPVVRYFLPRPNGASYPRLYTNRIGFTSPSPRLFFRVTLLESPVGSPASYSRPPTLSMDLLHVYDSSIEIPDGPCLRSSLTSSPL